MVAFDYRVTQREATIGQLETAVTISEISSSLNAQDVSENESGSLEEIVPEITALEQGDSGSQNDPERKSLVLASNVLSTSTRSEEASFDDDDDDDYYYYYDADDDDDDGTLTPSSHSSPENKPFPKTIHVAKGTMTQRGDENDDVIPSTSRTVDFSQGQHDHQREAPTTALGLSQIYKRIMVKGICRLLIFTLCCGSYMMGVVLYLVRSDHCGITARHLAGLSLLLSIDSITNFFVFVVSDTGFCII